MAGGFFTGSGDAGIDTELSVNPAGTQSPTYSTTEASPGGFFDTGADGVGVGGVPANISNDEARDAAKNAEGWAVGDTDAPLDGWSATNNSKYYSEQSQTSATAAADSATAARTAANDAETAERGAQTAETAARTAQAAAEAARDKADSDARRADSDADAARQAANEAKSDSESVADLARQVKADSETLSDLERRIDSDSEFIAEAERQIKADSESIANIARKVDSDAAAADSEATAAAASAAAAEVSRMAADSDVKEAMGWAIDTDTDGTQDFSGNSAKYWAEEAQRNASSTGTFLGLTDTPTTYSDSAGTYTRVNTDTDAIEFFNPFPVSNNRLGTLNGMRIRSFDNTNGEIVFATFTPTGTLSINPTNSLNWDQAITGFTMAASNPADFPNEFIASVRSLTVNSTSLDVSGLDTDTERSANFSRTLTNNFLDPRTGAYDGAQGSSLSASSVLASNIAATLTVSNTFRWNAGGWSSGGSTNIGNIRIDARNSSFTATGTVHNTSNFSNITSVSTTTDTGTAGSATRSGNNYSATITSTNNLYHDTTVTGTWTGTFTRPTDVSNESATNRALTNTQAWTRTYTSQYPVWSVLSSSSTPTASLLGTLSNSGYALSTVVVDTNQAAWRGRRYTFNNSSGSDSMTGFIVAPQAIGFAVSDANFTNPDVQNAVFSGVTRTQLAIGHSGHTFNYYFYGFTVAAGATVRVDVSS